MNNQKTKKMLYISVLKTEEGSFFLFEKEDYLRDQNRLVFTDTNVSSMNAEDISPAELESVGVAVIVDLFAKIPGRRATVVYTNADRDNPKIFMDVERYDETRKRVHCCKIPVPEPLLNGGIESIEFRIQLGLIVVQSLLIDEINYGSNHLKRRTFSQ